MISIRKRGRVYQYCFEAGKVNGKRKQITKSGFKTKNEAFAAGQKAYDKFINGESTTECNNHGAGIYAALLPGRKKLRRMF